MKELVTEAQADMILGIIAVTAPILGIIIGAVARKTVDGFLIGLIGPAVFGLWKVHLFLGDRLGWTNVTNLTVQLIIFAALGLMAGVRIQRMIYRNRKLTADSCRLSAKKEERQNAG